MRNNLFAALLLVSLAFLASCSDTNLLTKHTWQMDETLVQIGNAQTYYKINGLNTTPYDYSKVRFTFRKDGTGSYTDGSDNVFQFTWAFNPTDKTKMTMVITYGKKVMTFAYSFVRITNNSFTYTENYSEGGVYVMSQNRYIPFP